MTFLEQIQANNDTNNPDRIKARELLAKMETPKTKETVTITNEVDGFGSPIKIITDANGENWIQFRADI